MNIQMNDFNGNILDSFDRLSLNSLSKSSPSTFQIKPTSRLLQPPLPNKSNLSHVPCKFYKQGTCTAGTNCIFSHNLDPTSESSVCKYFRKGNCKFGTKCALLHTMSPFKQPVQSSPAYADPFALSAPSQSPFSLLLLDESKYANDVDSFLLPSSLNDLLTPTELRQQQVPLSSSTSSHHHYRQPSYDSPAWFDEQGRYLTNAINIPGHHQHHIRNYPPQQDFLPMHNSNTLFEEDGPFIMEDTHCIDNTTTTATFKTH